ncbi:MAG: hypothetical protein MK078_17160 [Crocinitomicaceae bacterium]|nr:hypothetical protein [Crocinitomicaceae bacterium]
MTEAGKEIIALFKKKGKFTLAGNRENWEEIYHIDGKIICAGGESHGNIEKYRDEISEDDALRKIKSYFSSRARVFNRDSNIETDLDVLNYWKDHPYEG